MNWDTLASLMVSLSCSPRFGAKSSHLSRAHRWTTPKLRAPGFLQTKSSGKRCAWFVKEFPRKMVHLCGWSNMMAVKRSRNGWTLNQVRPSTSGHDSRVWHSQPERQVQDPVLCGCRYFCGTPHLNKRLFGGNALPLRV